MQGMSASTPASSSYNNVGPSSQAPPSQIATLLSILPHINAEQIATVFPQFQPIITITELTRLSRSEQYEHLLSRGPELLSKVFADYGALRNMGFTDEMLLKAGLDDSIVECFKLLSQQQSSPAVTVQTGTPMQQVMPVTIPQQSLGMMSQPPTPGLPAHPAEEDPHFDSKQPASISTFQPVSILDPIHAPEPASVETHQHVDTTPEATPPHVPAPDPNPVNDIIMEDRTEPQPNVEDIIRQPKSEHDDAVERLLREASDGHMQLDDEDDDMEIEEDDDMIQILDGDVWKTVAPNGVIVGPEHVPHEGSAGVSGWGMPAVNGTGWGGANGTTGASVSNVAIPSLKHAPSLSAPAPIRPSLRNRVSAADLNHTYAPSFVTESPGNWTLEFGDTDESEDDDDEESGDEQPAVTNAAAAPAKDSAAELAKRRKELEDKMKEFQRRIAEKEKAKNGGLIPRPGTPVGTSKAPGTPATVVTNGAAVPTSPELAAEIAKNLERRKLLEAEIATSEQELIAAQRTVTEDEADLAQLKQRATDNEATVTTLETEVSDIQAQMEQLRQQMESKQLEVAEVKKAGAGIASDMAARKKQLIVDGKKVADLQGNINSKRMQLVELVKAAKEKANAKRSVADSIGSPHKRRKTAEGVQGSVTLPPPADGDFIELPAEDDAQPRARSGPTGRNAEEVERALKELQWASAETTVYIMTLGGFSVDESVCTPSFLREAGFPMVEKWVTDGDEERLKKPNRQASETKFAPYESALSKFRSFRLTSNFDKEVSSVTWSNKVNPFNQVCRFELEGDPCHDGPRCAAQHFWQMGLDDNALVEELLGYVKNDQRPVAATLRQKVNLMRAIKRKPSEILKNVREYFKSNEKELAPIAMHRRRTYTDPNPADRALTGNTMIGLEDPSPLLILPPAQPLLFDGLQKLLEGKEPSPGRYWQCPTRPESAEQIESEDAHNVALWMALIQDQIPKPLTLRTLQSNDMKTRTFLHTLTRALHYNSTSRELWNLYLGTYSRRDDVKDEECREEWESAVGFCPLALEIWWGWANWEKGTNGKVRVLRKLLAMLFDDDLERGAGLDRDVRCHAILNAILGLARIVYEVGKEDGGREYLLRCLLARSVEEFPDVGGESGENGLEDLEGFEDTLLGRCLGKEKVSFLWNVYLYAVWLGRLPECIWHAYPHAYFLKDEMFGIVWGAAMEESDGTAEKKQTIVHILEKLSELLAPSPDDTPESCRAYAVLIRNYARFLFHIGKTAPETEEILDTCLDACSGWVPELLDIRAWIAQKAGSFKIGIDIVKEYLGQRPHEWGLWNRAIGLAVRNGDKEEVLRTLINCVRTCFTKSEDVEEIDDDAVGETILLYKKVLALETPELVDRDFRPDLNRSSLNCNPFLWLNYLMLLSVDWDEQGEVGDLRSAWEKAVEGVADGDGRGFLWEEYLKAEAAHGAARKEGVDSKHVISVFGRAVKDLGWTREHPFNHELDLDFMKLRMLKGVRMPYRLLEICLTALPGRKQINFVEYLRANVADLAANASTAKVFVENNDVRSARLAIYELLKSDPGNVGSWRTALEFEKALGNHVGMKKLQDQAKDHLPQGSLVELASIGKVTSPVAMRL
ncbi:Zinc finger C3H1 domain-containing protein [Rhizophlyctis rosea]|uniref:Zinc finger C3H1 domain-containing protein n=1 Tax=Rhizophlyctis rosea TaxID=64517 RepID=A0AAD5SG81_9FUNG|nr:Zinc finger C3H1 domain-containing protein [Rhizophlyctis rosea]